MVGNWRRFVTAVEFALALLFLIQALTKIQIIPLELALSFIGQSSDPVHLLFSAFFAIASFIALASLCQLFLILFAMLRKDKVAQILSQKLKDYFAVALRAFLSIWLTFFVGGILSALGVFPLVVGVEYMNFYLFCFFSLNLFSERLNTWFLTKRTR